MLATLTELLTGREKAKLEAEAALAQAVKAVEDEAERRLQVSADVQGTLRAELLALGDAVRLNAAQKAALTVTTTDQLGALTDRMLTAAKRTEQVSSEVCSASETAVAHTRAISDAAERLAETIQSVNAKLHRTSTSTSDAVDASARARATISELSSAVSKIGEVVSVIREIAAQTNLLALNATIEAARAGEAGKGFAVVANEVKQLSTQTARSTEEIRAKIDEIIRATQRTVDANEEISRLIVEVNTSAGEVGSAMEAQSAATREIVDSVSQTLPAVERAAKAMQGVRGEANEADAVAREVKGCAEQVASNTSELRNIIEDIVNSVASTRERRGPARFAVNAAAELSGPAEYDVEGLEARTDGDLFAAVNIENISLTGALITGAGKLKAGQKGNLYINRKPVAYTVVGVTPYSQRIAFVQPVSADFREAFEAITKGLVPISQGGAKRDA